MRVVCNGTRVERTGPDSPSSIGADLALYELSHSSHRPSILHSRGAWRIVVRYSNVLSLERKLLDEGAAKLGLEPLSRFAPYRIGASGRSDVVTERSRGLCRFLEHVLVVTEPSKAPPQFAALLDDFVTRYSVSMDLEPWTQGKHSFPWELGEDNTPVPLSAVKTLTFQTSFVEGAAADVIKNDSAREQESTRDSLFTPCSFSDFRPFVEKIASHDAGKSQNTICRICGEHLQRTKSRVHLGRADPTLKGCVRLRTCGHELHNTCFMDLVERKVPGKPRRLCPVCGEIWCQWADVEHDPPPMQLDNDAVHLAVPPGRARTAGEAQAVKAGHEHGAHRREFLVRSGWFAENPTEAQRQISGHNRTAVVPIQRAPACEQWLPKQPPPYKAAKDSLQSLKKAYALSCRAHSMPHTIAKGYSHVQ